MYREPRCTLDALNDEKFADVELDTLLEEIMFSYMTHTLVEAYREGELLRGQMLVTPHVEFVP